MNTPPNQAPCPQCGKPLPEDSPEHLCPHCIMGQALEELGIADKPQAPQDPVRLRYLGDYELEEEIGRGAMGVVFRARQTSLDRTVAIKLLIGGFWASKPAIDRFRDEARSAAKLRHPNIVTIHEVGNFQGQAYFSMDYVPGHNLQEELDKGPLEAYRAAKLALTLATAVSFAHRHGVIHRDLKPSNILLDSDGNPVISDFGLAKNLEAESGLTLSGTILGTPGFMPPEQLQASIRPSTSNRVECDPVLGDIYSLGAILYAILTGTAPVAGETILDVALRQTALDPTPPRKIRPEIPRDLETICLKCLSRSPLERYASASDFAFDLECFLAGRPISVGSGNTSRLHRFWIKVRKPAIALLVLAPLAHIAFDSIRQREQRSQKEAKAVATAQANRHREDLLLERAQVSRLSGDPHGSLETLARAVKEVGSSSRLRKEAVTTLSVPFFQPQIRHEVITSWDYEVSEDGSRFASIRNTDNRGFVVLEVKDVVSGEVLAAAQGKRVATSPLSSNLALLTPPTGPKVNLIYFSRRQGALKTVPLEPKMAETALRSTWVLDNEREKLAFATDSSTWFVWSNSHWFLRPLTVRGTLLGFTNSSLLYANKAGVYKKDVHTGETVQVLAKSEKIASLNLSSSLAVVHSSQGDSKLEVQNLANGDLRATITLSPGENNNRETLLSKNGKLLAISDDRGASGIQVWRLDYPGAQPISLENNENRQVFLSGADFTENGRFLAAFGATNLSSGTLIWDLATGHEIANLEETYQPAWSSQEHLFTFGGAEGESLDDSSAPRVSIAGEFEALRSHLIRWTLSAPVQSVPVPQATDLLAFSQQGDRLQVGSEIWQLDPPSKSVHYLLEKTHSETVTTLSASNGTVFHIELPADPSSGPLPFGIQREGAEPSNLVAATYPTQPPVKSGNTIIAMATDAALGPDGKSLAVSSLLFLQSSSSGGYDSYGSALELWDLETNQRESLWNENQLNRFFQFLELSPHGDLLAVGSSQGASLWSFPEGRHLRDLQHSSLTQALAFSPDGQRIFSAGGTDRIESSHIDGSDFQSWPSHQGSLRTLALSADGRYLATGGRTEEVGLWNPESGEEVARWTAHRRGLVALAFHPTAPVLATLGGDGLARVWNLEAIAKEMLRYGMQFDERLAQVPEESGKTQAISSGPVDSPSIIENVQQFNREFIRVIRRVNMSKFVDLSLGLGIAFGPILLIILLDRLRDRKWAKQEAQRLAEGGEALPGVPAAINIRNSKKGVRRLLHPDPEVQSYTFTQRRANEVTKHFDREDSED